MSRTFAYCRVSTGEQSVENQIEEIARAGFDIKPSRIITDTVSGAKPMEQRTGFQKLLEKLEEGDKLICTKLDRLGRSVADVRVTLDKLKALGVEVHCLALPRIDGSSAIGELMTNIILSFAEFERSLLRDRTKSALQRLKAEGKQLGRPKAINDDQAQAIRQKLKDGMSISALAKSYGVSRATVMRLKE